MRPSLAVSAAARRLRKSHSPTPLVPPLRIWRRIWDFHYLIDHRQPVLTEEGKRVLSYVQAIYRGYRVDEVALTLSGETEARLTFRPSSDTLHPDSLEVFTPAHLIVNFRIPSLNA